jgi:hypothetical protein
VQLLLFPCRLFNLLSDLEAPDSFVIVSQCPVSSVTKIQKINLKREATMPKLLHHLRRLSLLISLLVVLSNSSAAQSFLSDQKAGSVLFFNKYKSSITNPSAEDTQISITNTHQSLPVEVHLFFVDGNTCSVADTFIHLTPNQTVSFLASDFDPGVQGYLVAIAGSGFSPTQFNFLIGNARLRELDGRQADLQAVAVSKLSPGDVTSGNLVFNGIEYEQLPQVIALSSFNSQLTDSTHLVLYSPPDNLIAGGGAVTVRVFALIYDDIERPFSTNFNVNCYAQIPLNTLRVNLGLNNIVPLGRTGWIRLNSLNRPILGSVLNKGPIFNSGHNLHTLALFSSFTMTVPAF